MDLGSITKFVIGLFSGNWQMGLLFGAIGLIALPIVLPILKRIVSNFISDIKQKAAEEQTSENAQSDFENKIELNDKNNEIAQNDDKGSQSDKINAIEDLKKK